MKKIVASVGKAAVFARSPQGKRDIALIVAAVGAAADFAKQIHLI